MTRIGVSPRLFHPQPEARGIHSKRLHYLENSVADWILSRDALVFLIPACDRAAQYAASLDGLVLQGGVDISPLAYGEEPLQPEWAGDPVRDRFEIALVRAFADAAKPVLGICRGAQLINVAFGGSLHQDIAAHRSDDYDAHAHEIRFEPGSGLARLYGEAGARRVVSIHHQAIKRLGRDLTIEARAEPDGHVEAVRLQTAGTYIYGVQWHPEFHAGRSDCLDGAPLLDEFLGAARGEK